MAFFMEVLVLQVQGVRLEHQVAQVFQAHQVLMVHFLEVQEPQV
jgi:hypothetical protein